MAAAFKMSTRKTGIFCEMYVHGCAASTTCGGGDWLREEKNQYAIRLDNQ